MSEKPEPPDFELTKYGYDREHELELNKFTHALEVEQLKLLILLNGGAATALITFADDMGLASMSVLVVPVGLWLSGLCVGAWAVMTMRKAQSAFSQAYRFRRNASEWRQLAEHYGADVAAARLGNLGLHLEAEIRAEFRDGQVGGPVPAASPLQEEDGAVLRDTAAAMVFRKARETSRLVDPLSLLSLGLFLLGALAAGWSVLGSPLP